MRIILVGYGEMLLELALGILESKHEIVGILRSETIKQNKIQIFLNNYIKPSMEYLFIKAHKLNEIEVKSVNSIKFRRLIKDLKADAVIVGSWSERFSIETLNTLPDGFINVHPSLLPKYRGPNPYIQVILNGEKITGVTFHLMDRNYDTGEILHQKEVPILKDDTGGSLKIRCTNTARHEIKFVLDNFCLLKKNKRKQDESKASYQVQISLKETIIEFEKESSIEIDRRIKALSPWQKCYLPLKNKFFTFEKYSITSLKSEKPPGTIINKTKNSIFIVCKDSTVMCFIR